MWICLSDGFLSIVDKAVSPDCLVVRARREGDIERYFPEAKVQKSPKNDYLYRAEIPRETVARVISDYLISMSYSNFKNSVADEHLHALYSRVWGTMRDLQLRGEKP